jgi:hypothetical protein
MLRYTDPQISNGQRIGQQQKMYVKPEAAIKVFELLMMSGV